MSEGDGKIGIFMVKKDWGFGKEIFNNGGGIMQILWDYHNMEWGLKGFK